MGLYGISYVCSGFLHVLMGVSVSEGLEIGSFCPEPLPGMSSTAPEPQTFLNNR